jgi:hypothetical protein
VVDTISAALAFLSSRAGLYEVAENNTVLFQKTEDAESYNAHLAKLQIIAAQQEKLDRDVQEENERTAKGMARVLSGQP